MPSLRISFNTHFDVLYDIFVQFVNRFGGSGDCLSWRGDRLSDRARADPHRLGVWAVYRDLRAVSRTDVGAPRGAGNSIYRATAALGFLAPDGGAKGGPKGGRLVVEEGGRAKTGREMYVVKW